MQRDSYLFSSFLGEQTKLIYGTEQPDKVDDYWVKQALNLQMYSVADALRDAFIKTVTLSDRAKAPRARYYVLYGAGRRLQMIWHGYRSLMSIAPIERENPLSSDDAQRVTQDINTIYINVRGVLDNLCWALLHEHAPEKLEQLRPSSIGLFLKGCIKDDSRFEQLSPTINELDTWDREVKSRRDPAVHGIPLSVPPQLVTAEEAEIYRELMQQHADAAALLNFDEAESIMKQIDNLGKFMPWFVHDPDEPPMPIYPIVSDDLGQLLVLFHAIEQAL